MSCQILWMQQETEATATTTTTICGTVAELAHDLENGKKMKLDE